MTLGLQGKTRPALETYVLTPRMFTPSRMAPTLLELGLTLDQLTQVRDTVATWSRAVNYRTNRVLQVTDRGASWQTWRNSTGIDLLEVGFLKHDLLPVTLTSIASSMRPKMRRLDDHRVAMIHEGVGGIQLTVFDDRGYVSFTANTGYPIPADCYSANPQVACINNEIVIFPNNGTDCYVWSCSAVGVLAFRRTVSMGTGSEFNVTSARAGHSTVNSSETYGLVVQGATGVVATASSVLLVLRDGFGTGVREYAQVLDVGTGETGLRTALGVGYNINPGSFGHIEEVGLDLYQSGGVAADPAPDGYYIGIIAKRARFSPTSDNGQGTLPGVRALQLRVFGLTAVVSMDGLRRVGSESLATSQQFCYEEVVVGRDDGTRWAFSGYGDDGNGKVVNLRLLPDNYVSGDGFLEIRQVLGVDNPTLADTFDQYVFVVPWASSLPIPALPRAPIPQPPTRAYYFSGVNNGQALRGRVFHKNRGRGVLKAIPRSLVTNYDQAVRRY